MNLQDAIYELLGVPPAEQPADHYRLLGLARFEPNREVIANAASRQMLFVRQLAAGPYTPVSQELLAVLSEAKACLLDPQRREDYDIRLRAQLMEASSVVAASSADLGSLSSWFDSTAGICLSTIGSAEFDAAPEGEDDEPATEPAMGVRPPAPAQREMAPMSAAEVDSVHDFPTSPNYVVSNESPAPTPDGERQWVVGADSRCDIIVHCPYVSRRHCKIIEADGSFWVEDLGSRNGTHVNHQRIRERAPVTSEDLITLGTLARMPWPPETAPAFESGSEVRIIRIGRSPSNDIVLNHSSVSRRHAQLSLIGGCAMLEDLGSTNGTYVGESALRINRRRVAPHDMVRIGKFRMPVSHLLHSESVA